jgi:type II secretory pathway component HofQ
MKTFVIVLVALSAVGCNSVQEERETSDRHPVVQESTSSQAFVDEDIRRVLETLAKDAEVNLIITREVQGTVSFVLEDECPTLGPSRPSSKPVALSSSRISGTRPKCFE